VRACVRKSGAREKLCISSHLHSRISCKLSGAPIPPSKQIDKFGTRILTVPYCSFQGVCSYSQGVGCTVFAPIFARTHKHRIAPMEGGFVSGWVSSLRAALTPAHHPPCCCGRGALAPLHTHRTSKDSPSPGCTPHKTRQRLR